MLFLISAALDKCIFVIRSFTLYMYKLNSTNIFYKGLTIINNAFNYPNFCLETIIFTVVKKDFPDFICSE